jgi:phosphate uptake regulator
MGDDAPTLSDLVKRGAEATLAEIEARDRAHEQALRTFVDRMMEGPEPDLDEVWRIRHATREP